MYCTQCGCKIEEGFKFCPGCGCEVEAVHSEDTKSEFDRIADEIFRKYPLEQVTSIRIFREQTGCDLKTARDTMYIRYHGKTPKEIDEERKAEYKQAKMELKESLNRAANILSSSKKNKTPRCPKCGNTSISYGQKPSLGRAVVGYGIAGSAGAVVGSMTGKKGYAVCLNCGKTWRI